MLTKSAEILCFRSIMKYFSSYGRKHRKKFHRTLDDMYQLPSCKEFVIQVVAQAGMISMIWTSEIVDKFQGRIFADLRISTKRIVEALNISRRLVRFITLDKAGTKKLSTKDELKGLNTKRETMPNRSWWFFTKWNLNLEWFVDIYSKRFCHYDLKTKTK